MCNISNYSEVVNKIKQLAVFTLEESEFVDFNLLKTVDIYFEKFCLNNKNLKQTNTVKFL